MFFTIIKITYRKNLMKLMHPIQYLYINHILSINIYIDKHMFNNKNKGMKSAPYLCNDYFLYSELDTF